MSANDRWSIGSAAPPPYHRAMAETPVATEPLVAASGVGRSFSTQRTVRLGDVDPTGRLRLDALARHAQDVSDDDTADAALDPDPGWVVRRTEVDVLVPGQLGEALTYTTFCSGLGGRWAERRLSVTGESGARYELATLWICVDVTSGKPVPLTDQFHRLYGPAADGRKVSARLRNAPPGERGGSTIGFEWPLRRVDFDTLGHVNNAAYWAVIEELSPVGAVPEPPFRARLEFGSGLAPDDRVRIVADAALGACSWLVGEGSPAASANLTPLAAGLYR